MAIFYLLPPRSAVGDRLADSLSALLPGLQLDFSACSRLADIILESLQNENVFIVSRDQLPTGEAVDRALIDGFGATDGDEIIEVRPAARPGEFASRRWRIAGCTAELTA